MAICSNICFQFWGVYPEMELLDHMLILCLVFFFFETCIPFSKAVTILHFYQEYIKVPVSHAHKNILCSIF
jgi:hypothetical protein